ncbi:SAM-dependent methyltransferase [Bdellovibrio bacteriovorus]|uniref:SAM-dependent methyltransferase n=1 Tax=Bdellovibrio bacteriovorus TaxID=959 RepID=UPI0035A57C3C
MIAYLAPEKFLPELLEELKDVKSVHGNLVLTDGPLQNSVWAQNIWLDAQIIPFESISQASKALKGLGKLWACYTVENHRRAQLIQDQLPKLRPRVLDFLSELPEDNLGAWTLLDKNTLLASPTTNSRFPLGDVKFNEDKKTPPSRAYLKLWELFTVYGIRPKPGQKVVDFGSCPGGWTWVLQRMGCEVISIDRAPLEPTIAALPGVNFMKTNAFNVKPEDLGRIDWFYSDIICYPEKLLELVQTWQASGLCSNFVCTIKFQGETDYKTLKKFLQMEHTRIQHLHHNKHEVTVWIKPPLS